MRSPILAAALLAGLSVGACDCDGNLIMVPDSGMPPTRCLGDEDCEEREACNVAVGICFPLDECNDERPCPQPGQICTDNDGDGFLDCIFERCEEDSECADLECPPDLLPACVAGGCICGEPCSGGCPSGLGCCIPQDTCLALPPQCMGMECPSGQFLSVTSTGAWDTGQCEVIGENCACEDLPDLPLGDIGLYSAIAHSGQTSVLSAYNLDYGDLMFGVARPDGTVDWAFVDGVGTSTDTITGAIDGPRGGNSDPGEDLGLYTDIEVDASGRPHIVYQSRDQGALKYAVMDGAWRIHTVDGQGAGDTGLYSSLALDGQERPVVAYLSAREDGPGGRRSVLRIAFANTATPTDASQWGTRDLATLDLSGFGCAERCNVDEVCLSSNQSCAPADPPTACTPRCESGQRCVQGACVGVDGLPPFRDLPLARGLWPSMGILPDGSALVAFYDRFDRNLSMVKIQGPDLRTGAITTAVIDGNGAPGGSTDDAGLFPSLHVTPGGEAHLAYMNATRQSLWYRNFDPNSPTFADITPPEEVESGLTMGGGPDGVLIGADAAMVVDAQGVVRIAYQNATEGDLRYARRAATGQWTHLTLAGDEATYRGSFGFYADQVLTDDRLSPTVSTYRYFLSAPGGPDNGLELFSPP